MLDYTSELYPKLVTLLIVHDYLTGLIALQIDDFLAVAILSRNGDDLQTIPHLNMPLGGTGKCVLHKLLYLFLREIFSRPLFHSICAGDALILKLDLPTGHHQHAIRGFPEGIGYLII